MYIKSFDELTFQDNFIFQKVMLKKHICKAVLERLLDISIKDIVYIHEEKNLDVRWDTKSVRLDVFVNDDKGTVFNIEMQTSKDMEELVKRTRFYQSILDMYHIQKGQKYTTLNDSYIIFICTFPVFTGNRHKYTFKNVCIEDHDIALNDGATKLFLSTKGTQNDVSKPLQAFLDYIDGEEATDELLRDIDDAVYEVKHCEAWKEEYVMLSMDHYKYWKEGMAEGIAEGLAQGKAEGKSEGKIEVVIQMLRKQLSLEMIAEVTNFTVEDVRKIAEEHALM
ncbi:MULTISPECIES: Rpn family recombination-promoting nuclease/putative transposase [unclassified Veillonella]|uniref:Rpn family recombination-promoting nuclease/putative transposase n=1 Tax=unclassified Veillonella TaxID=2630086 RepID=UPI000F8D52F6|nr:MULTISPECIES: Rpn family recombination-promoting nuclease/putative transposase [unclassified Veillonella]